MSSIVAKQVAVVVKNFIGDKGFAFFAIVDKELKLKLGDQGVFVHQKDLVTNGFQAIDMVPGYSAVIDIKVENGKQRTGKIYEINCQTPRPTHLTRPKSKNAKSGKKPAPRKLLFYAGAKSSGHIKVIKERGFGFIEKAGHEDLFFPMKGIPHNLVPYLQEGVEVKFTVEDCERGVLARVIDIVWVESQIVRHQVDCNREKDLFVTRLTYPTKQNKLEVRNAKGELVSEPATLTEARDQIGKSTVSQVEFAQSGKRKAS